MPNTCTAQQNQSGNQTPEVQPEPVLDLTSTLPADTDLLSHAFLTAVMEDDVKRLNHSLNALRQAWAVSFCVDDICKLALTTSKLIEARRRAMLLPFDAPKHASGDGNDFNPIQ